jgi:hypothetical protein
MMVALLQERIEGKDDNTNLDEKCSAILQDPRLLSLEVVEIVKVQVFNRKTESTVRKNTVVC